MNTVNKNTCLRIAWMMAILMISAAATAQVPDSSNLLLNGDFTQGEASWEMNKDGRATVVKDDDGGAYLRVAQEDLRNAYIDQIIDIPRDAIELTFTCRMRGPRIAPKGGWTGAFLMPSLLNDEGESLTGSNGYQSMRKNTSEWIESSSTLTVPHQATRARVRIGLFETNGEFHVTDVRAVVSKQGRRHYDLAEHLREARVNINHAQPMLDPVAPATGAPDWLINFQDFDHTLRVDPADLQALPTVGAAIEQARENRKKGESTRVVVAAGTYREPDGALLMDDLADPSGKAVIAIEAEKPSSVVLSGSEVFADWRAHEGMDGIYVHDWDKAWGFQRHWWGNFNTVIGPLGLRRENIWINGERQRQALLEREEQLVRVKAEQKGPVVQELNTNSWMVTEEGGPRRPYSDLEPGTFYVDDANKLLVMRPKPGVDPGKATVEVSTKTIGMSVFKGENIILRGLTIQHFANTYALARGSEANRWRGRGGEWGGVAFRVTLSRNILLEDMVSRENNGVGFPIIDANDLTARRIEATDNGTSGGGFSGVNMLFEDLKFNRNNWRGYLGDFTGWDGAGIKSTKMDRVTFRNVETNDNFAYGFWFDIHAIDVHIDGLVSTGNLRAGAYMEMFGGPVEMLNARLENNAMGLLLSGAANFSLKNSRIIGNATQITMRNDFRYRPVNFRFENNIISSRTDTMQNLVVKGDNVLDANGDQRIPGFQYWVPDIDGFGVGSQPLLMPNTPRLDSGVPNSWQLFLDTLQASGNTWYHPTLRHAFLDTDRWPIDFDTWKKLTGDTDARWHNPVGDTEDWRDRSDAVSALTKPALDLPPGMSDYTVDRSPEWPQDGALRINAGATEDWTDPQGRRWLADIHNENGKLFTGVGEKDQSLVRGKLLEETPEAIAATGLTPIYASERYLLDGYAIATPAGSYTVRLHFSENHGPIRAGNRQFGILVNGKTVFERLDVVNEAGGQGRPLVKEIKGVKPELFVDEDTRILNTGLIQIEFKRLSESAEAPMINAIEVVRE